MNSVALPGSVVSSSAAQTWAGSAALDHWDLIVIGSDFRGLERSLRTAGFRGRVGVVEQRGAHSNLLPASNDSAGTYARFLNAARTADRAAWPLAPGNAQSLKALPSSPAPQPAVPATDATDPFEIFPLPGWSVFTGPHTVAIHGREVAFHRAILATGSRTDGRAIEGLEATGFATPESLSSMTHWPTRVAVLGSGPRACELAQALRRFGSDVYLVAEEPSLLGGEEPAAAAVIQHTLSRAGVRLLLGWRCESAAVTGRAKAVVIRQESTQRKLLVDQIVLAHSCRANVERLGLQAAGIAVAERDGRPAIQVDSRLATTNARVFAVGAASAGDRSIEALERMCDIAVQNAVGVTRPRFDARLVPRLVATDPAVAQVGVTADGARLQGLDVESWWLPLSPGGEPRRSEQHGEVDGAETSEFAIVHLDRDLPGRVAGATFVGAHAAEALATVALLMAEELPISALGRATTLSSTYARALAQLGEFVERNALA